MMTKISVIKIYARTITKLQAEESLRRVQEMAVANGSVKKSERKTILDGWVRDVRGHRERVNRKKKKAVTPEEMRARLAGMGVGIEWRKH